MGHVGCGLIQLIERQAELRLPGHLIITGITARSRDCDRVCDMSSYQWFDTPQALAASEEIDVFVELIGGTTGASREAVNLALSAGKPVVTANKALIAEQGAELAELAEKNGVDLLFEAAVAGGVPIVRALRDSFSGVIVNRVSGILNGTCNFLTTEMLSTCRSYEAVLQEAQALGYAEADPTLDVSGMDAAHKAAILSSIAFSADIDFEKVSVSGVEQITLVDLKFADRLGYSIKLIAEGVLRGDSVVCRVEPKALPLEHPFASVNGSLNAVRVDGEALGAVTFTGPGAGAGPTASAVMGDIAKLFRPSVRSPFGRTDDHPLRHFVQGQDTENSPWFVRGYLADKPGALAALSDALARANVSIDKLLQDSAASDGASPFAICTHVCTSAQMHKAVHYMESLSTIIGVPRFIRIETDL